MFCLEFVNIFRYGGLLLTHNEVAVDDGDGTILPTWTAVDSSNVRTPRELFESMRRSGWSVEVNSDGLPCDLRIDLLQYHRQVPTVQNCIYKLNAAQYTHFT